jgi:hypothetical protein
VHTIECRYIKPPNNSAMHGDAYEAAGCFAGRYLMSIILTIRRESYAPSVQY